ncbi:TPA: acyltransferase [Citrobacter koseri]|nr:acyltransferase [Citrobacter koseri]HEM8490006.1 acyltransferase [Citrobacter koseri]
MEFNYLKQLILMNKNSFRFDINALRAFSVISVMIFHFFPNALPGGFLGVDVFFVISGFLMTSIIARGVNSNNFSFSSFYAARSKRIIPALVFVCLMVLFSGYFLLTPPDYSSLSEHVLSSILFISNFNYYLEAGYFDSESHLKWLLHTWSLSVEWQFYIIYPIILYVICKSFGKSSINKTIVVMFVLSLIASVYITRINPSQSYFMIHTRAWEMLAGGIAYSIGDKLTDIKNGKYLSLSLWFVLIGSLFFINSSIAWPGYMAAIPVMCAALLIAINKNFSIYELNFVKITGLVSYSLYLWHWPVSVFIYRSTLSDDVMAGMLGIVLSFCLAYLTYKFIERLPERISADSLKRASVIVSSLVLTSLASVYVYRTDGVSSRYPVSTADLASITDAYKYFDFANNMRGGVCHNVDTSKDVDYFIKHCFSKSKTNIFLYGDSYAATLYHGLQKLAEKDKDIGIAQITYGNGSPFFNVDGDTSVQFRNVKDANEFRLKALKAIKPEIVLISWRYDGPNAIHNKKDALASIENTIERIKDVSPSSRVVVLGPTPGWNNGIINILLEYSKKYNTEPPYRTKFGLAFDSKKWDSYFSKHLKNAKYISSYNELCNDDGCMTRTGPTPKELLYVDYGHLSQNGSDFLIGKISNQIIN